MSPKKQDNLVSAWRSLLGAHRRLTQRINEDLAAAHVLSLEQYDALYVVYLAPARRMRLAELAQAALLSRSGLTRLVDRLEERGWLQRVPSVEDRRGSYAAITSAGIEQLRLTWPVYRTALRKYLGSLSVVNLCEMQRILEALESAALMDK